MSQSLSVVIMGASGAVGGHVVAALAGYAALKRMTLLVRRPLTTPARAEITQHTVDVMDVATYRALLPGHRAAVCTLGMGQPSKFSKEEFVRVDRDSVLAFAAACKQAGVEHFELLGSVGANAKSSSFYLRTKGELEEGLKALGFARLSLFRPSMILTPTNRYGWSQAVVLKIWPLLNPFLVRTLRKYRGIRIELLGAAIANNLLATPRTSVETLQWDQFVELASG